MGNSYKHQGAVSDEATYFRIAKCIYSSEEKMYDLPGKAWNETKQSNLDSKFMKEDCSCKVCTENRERRQRIIDVLLEAGDTDGLRAMGYQLA